MSQNLYLKLILAFTMALLIIIPTEGQSTSNQENIWQEPWEGVPEYYKKWTYPDFHFPDNLSTWKNERTKVKETLGKLLGEIPPRPMQLKVKTVFREERNGYILEKFIIDNEVDSWIPGYSDAGSPLSGIKVLENKLQSVYRLYDKEENFNSIVYEKTGHVFTDEMKIEMINWFIKHLKN